MTTTASHGTISFDPAFVFALRDQNSRFSAALPHVGWVGISKETHDELLPRFNEVISPPVPEFSEPAPEKAEKPAKEEKKAKDKE